VWHVRFATAIRFVFAAISTEIVTVEHGTSDGSTTAGVDYQASNGNLQNEL
jgi:hypothetical protein